MPRKAVHKTDIPFHKMEQTSSIGFELHKIDDEHRHISENEDVLRAHRDDHYIFLLMEKGHGNLMVDFNLVEMRNPCLFVILPSQVHQYIQSKNAYGWLVAVDPSLVGETFRPVFEDRLSAVNALSLSNPQTLLQCLQLLNDISLQIPAPAYQRHTMYALLTSFVAMAAAVYTGSEQPVKGQVNRSISINREFRKLVKEKYTTVKNPADYARLLNISPSYLNEVIKAATGSSVSYWIQYEIMLEARRLLYHSDLSVKEIAHRVGYEDHTYFQRLFKKVTKCTPLQFRNRYRELSNTNP